MNIPLKCEDLHLKIAELEGLLREAQAFVERGDDDSQEWMDLSSAISNSLSRTKS